MKTLGDLVEKNRKKAFDKKKKDFMKWGPAIVLLGIVFSIDPAFDTFFYNKWPHISEEQYFYERMMSVTYLYECIVLIVMLGYIYLNVRKGIVLAKSNFKALRIGSIFLGIRAFAVFAVYWMGAEHLPHGAAFSNSVMADFRFTLYLAFFLWFIAKFMEYGIELKEEQDSIV